MEKNINTYEVKKESSLAKLIKCISQFKVKIFIGIAFSAFAAILRLMSPLLIGQISKFILEGTTPGATIDFAKIFTYAGFVFGCYGLSFVFDVTQVYFITGVTSDTNRSLRNKMATKINTLPLNYFDTRNIGDILSYVTNDVDLIGLTLNNTLSNLISSTITLLGSVIILFILEWRIGLIALVALPLALIVLSIIGKKAEKSFKSRQDLTSEVSSLAEESYTAYYIVKSFNATESFKNNFANANLRLEKASFKADTFAGLMTPMMIFFGNLIFAAICLVGGYIAGQFIPHTAEATTGIVIVVTAVSYGEQLISPLSSIANLLATFQQALAATSRVYSMLEQTDEPDESNKKLTLKKIDGNIAFEHVRFGYTKDRVIIHDFSQEAKSGQKIAIVGPTGAGKTTMVNLLMRFYEINGGKITIEGVDTTKMNRSYVRSLFGMVLQDTWLFEGSFMENLKFSRRDASDEEVIEACKATHCHEFIMQQAGGYKKILKEDCGLSSGQKQLLTIARAMVQNAPMLILDEATSSVDTRTELLIQDAMDKLMKGRTSFVIAHRLSTIKNANMIIVMKDGDVVECGNHDTLLQKGGLYADLYNSQFANKRN